MNWTIIDTWIVLDLIIVAISATTIGLHLVLRRESLLGDGISHAVLPGIALGFIIMQSRDSVVMLFFATLMGILTAVLTEYIAVERKIDSGASLGVVFSGLFAIGLILIASISQQVDLDPSCVLFGAVELTPLDLMTIRNIEIPRAVVSNGVVMLVNILVICIMYRSLNVSVFDPQFARTLGLKVRGLRYVHIILVSITTVVAFESVGSILIITLLVVPQIIGLLLSQRMKLVIIISLCTTILASILGHIMAVQIPTMLNLKDTNTVGSISLVLGLFLLIAVLCSPRGPLIKKYYLLINQIQVSKEDILKLLYKHTKNSNIGMNTLKKLLNPYFITGRISVLSLLCALFQLKSKKYIYIKNRNYYCTPMGEEHAKTLEERHRMWEDYLYNKAEINAKRVHQHAEDFEHIDNKKIISSLKEVASFKTKIPGHSHLDEKSKNK